MSSTDVESARLEIVFIDSRAEDIDAFITELRASGDDSRLFEVFLIDQDADGITLIGEALNRFDGVDAIHIVSHGDNGSIQLGNTQLDATSLAERKHEVAAWSQHVSDEADLLIYGCNWSAGSSGRALLLELSETCGCDIAASDDLTGHASLGGDWELEFSTGIIESIPLLARSSKLIGFYC